MVEARDRVEEVSQHGRAEALRPSSNGASGARAAGGVVLLKATEAGTRIAVVACGGVVSLPRAEVGPGEGAEDAAGRAARVFLGCDVRLVASVGETREVDEGVETLTWFWAARLRRASRTRPMGPPPSGFESHWLDLDEAADLLDSEDEGRLVARLGRQPLRRRRKPLASPEHRAIRYDVESLRDATLASVETETDPGARESLYHARIELERAEDRLERGEDAAARRAYARAERDALTALDDPARVATLKRGIDRLSPAERDAFDVRPPQSIVAASLDEVLRAQSLVQGALEERARRERDLRSAQIQATLAFGVTALAVVVVASLDLFRPTLNGGPHIGSETLAVVYLVAGACGGWAGEALLSLRSNGREGALWLPLAAGAGAVAGLILGALVTDGLATPPAPSSAALTLAGAFAAGWLGRRVVPRVTENTT